MRSIQGYAEFKVPVKPAGQTGHAPAQAGQTYCRIRRPDGGYVTHIGTHEEIMNHLKSLCPNGKVADLKSESTGARP